MINQHGKPLDELDIARLQSFVSAREYSIVSEDGAPICGRVIDGENVERFIAVGWKNA